MDQTEYQRQGDLAKQRALEKLANQGAVKVAEANLKRKRLEEQEKKTHKTELEKELVTAAAKTAAEVERRMVATAAKKEVALKNKEAAGKAQQPGDAVAEEVDEAAEDDDEMEDEDDDDEVVSYSGELDAEGRYHGPPRLD